MAVKRSFWWFLGLTLLTCGACENKKPAAPPPPEVPPLDYGCGALYFSFAEGFSLYIGTVTDMQPEPSQPGRGGLGDPPIMEQGELKFKVEKTLFGQSFPELQMRYAYSRYDDGPKSDWGGSRWDNHPPREGKRLAMLICPTMDENSRARKLIDPDAARTLWDAPLGNPFIQELTEACGFISASVPEKGHGRDKDREPLVKDRIGLVKRFGGSKYPTIREFVQDAVFGSTDPNHHPTPELASATPELMLEYLWASSTIEKDYARAKAIGRIAAWLRIKDHFHTAPQELRLAYGHWCLARLDDPRRDRETLVALHSLWGICHDYGVEETVSLFPEEGRPGLVRRAEACAASPGKDYPEKEIQEEARKLLAVLKEK
jgi:hypothetical protein